MDLHSLNTKYARTCRPSTGEREEDVMEGFWECFVEGTDGGRHYKHYSLQSAVREAERLARLPDVQGKVVYLFECVGRCSVEQTPVKWEVPR